MSAEAPAASSRPHRASRVDDAWARSAVLVLRRRGWVERVVPYTGYGSTGWVRVLGRVVLAAPGTDAAEAAEHDAAASGRAVRGWRSFFTAQVPGAAVQVRVGDVVHDVRADRGGYVDVVLPSDLAPGWQEVELTAGGRAVRARVVVVGPEQRTALLSDIDDTVMVTALPRPLIAAWNALVLHENARRVVPGMAELYARWHAANPGSPTFYLSTGAWNVAPALDRFLARHRYPAGPLLLTDWGPTNSGWFRSGPQHKRETLRRLLRELPQVRWLLVGDDGQHDPEVYGELVAEHPGRVALVAIRRLSVAEQVLAHGTPLRASAEPSAAEPRTVHGQDGHELIVRLLDAGVLRPPGG